MGLTCQERLKELKMQSLFQGLPGGHSSSTCVFEAWQVFAPLSCPHTCKLLLGLKPEPGSSASGAPLCFFVMLPPPPPCGLGKVKVCKGMTISFILLCRLPVFNSEVRFLLLLLFFKNKKVVSVVVYMEINRMHYFQSNLPTIYPC